MSRMRFDEKIEAHLNEIMINLRALGIKPTRQDALRVIIEMNKEAQVRIIKRKRKSKFGVLFQ